MEKVRIYDFDSIGDYDTEKLGFGNSFYYQFEINDDYYGDNRLWKSLRGIKNEIPLKEPIMFVTDDIEDEHQLDDGLTDEEKASFHTPDLWRMPLLYKEHNSWVVQEDLCKAICDAITVGEYEVYDAEIYNSHMNKTFKNYKVIHFINITPNMEISEFDKDDQVIPDFTKMVFNKKDFNEFIGYKFLFGGPFVTDTFKSKLENFSKELCFSYEDFEASELKFDIFCTP